MASRSASTSALVAGLRSLTVRAGQRGAIRTASTYAAPEESSSSSSRGGNGSWSRSRAPQLPPVAPLPARMKPSTPSYFSGRPAFVDSMLEVDEMTRKVRRVLEQARLLPANSTVRDVAKASPLSMRGSGAKLWLTLPDLNVKLGARLTATQYRRLVARLALMVRYSRMIKKLVSEAEQSDSPDDYAPGVLGESGVAHEYETTLDKYMSEYAKTHDLLAEVDNDKEFWDTANSHVDRHGRAYAVGRRKESSAQVWLIRKKDQPHSTGPPNDDAAESEETALQTAPPAANVHDSVGEIIINNLPLGEYFSRNAEREAVTWPLKITSTLGMYNVFAIARSGGKSGQAGAIAHALARALVFETAHSFPIDQGLPLKKYIRSILSKDGVLTRDPRMVERKKTGLAKARKAYTWVKR